MNALWLRTAFLGVGVIAVGVCSAGCATVIHGTKQKVEVVTTPSGATATAAGQTVQTPGTLVLPRKSPFVDVRIEKEGYATRMVRLQRSGSSVVWWNLMMLPAGGAAGGAIGAGSGSGWSSLGGAAVGGVAGGALLPAVAFGVDYGNGAAYEFIPSRIVMQLEPVEAAGPAK